MAQFEDVLFEYEGKEYKIKANKVLRAFRKISPMLKVEYMVNMESLYMDNPSLFTDVYVECLVLAGLDVRGDLEEVQDNVLVWATSSTDNFMRMFEPLQYIKMCLTNPPASVVKKVGAKKPRSTKKK